MNTFFMQVSPSVATTDEMSLFDFILKGGVFLIPIAVLFVYTLYITFERFLFIRRVSGENAILLNNIENSLKKGNTNEAISIAKQEQTGQGRIILEGLQTVGRPISEIESNMEMVTNIEIATMEKKMNHLGIIAGIAPTLGFVGTISGVIKIFYNISITENISIGNISGGLYEKMISSGAGLIVGIIAYSFYHILTGRIDNFALKAQKNILKFINIIQRS